MSDSRMPGSHFAECYFMKPQRFEYRAPDPLDGAVALLAVDQAAKPIARGQSLVAVLASGSDLRRLPWLGDIVLDVDGVRLGAKVRLARHRGRPAALGSVSAFCACRPLPDPYRGTIGGSLAHAD